MRNKQSESSNKRGKGRKTEALDRPFDPRVLARASDLANAYRFMLERTGDGRYLARAVEFPTVFVHAPTPNECERKIREALTVAVASMIEAGEAPPLPADERRAQVNMRVSAGEKTLLEESARRAGFRGLSDFVRFAALSFARGDSVRRAG